jgi:hypothetical protein
MMVGTGPGRSAMHASVDKRRIPAQYYAGVLRKSTHSGLSPGDAGR